LETGIRTVVTLARRELRRADETFERDLNGEQQHQTLDHLRIGWALAFGGYTPSAGADR